jgi:cyclopropane fatty-acyl-phospholipid synthase-like methyltransferase
MSLVYRAMYRFGFTPWDTGEVPAELKAIVQGAGALPPGHALDIGCGTGTQAVYLAQHGWEVTAVDNVDRPLQRARDRSRAAKVSVDWVKADVSRLSELGLTGRFELLFDRGCFHGLNSAERDAYARGVDSLAAPGAVLLLMAFARNRVPAGPGGAGRDEIEAAFAGWTLRSAEPDSGPPPGGPLKNVSRTWYRLERA